MVCLLCCHIYRTRGWGVKWIPKNSVKNVVCNEKIWRPLKQRIQQFYPRPNAYVVGAVDVETTSHNTEESEEYNDDTTVWYIFCQTLNYGRKRMLLM